MLLRFLYFRNENIFVIFSMKINVAWVLNKNILEHRKQILAERYTVIFFVAIHTMFFIWITKSFF